MRPVKSQGRCSDTQWAKAVIHAGIHSRTAKQWENVIPHQAMNQYSWAWDDLAQRVGTEGISRWIQQGMIDAKDIRALQKTPTGSECLRLIVRDDIKGCGEAIANALWEGLK